MTYTVNCLLIQAVKYHQKCLRLVSVTYTVNCLLIPSTYSASGTPTTSFSDLYGQLLANTKTYHCRIWISSFRVTYTVNCLLILSIKKDSTLLFCFSDLFGQLLANTCCVPIERVSSLSVSVTYSVNCLLIPVNVTH